MLYGNNVVLNRIALYCAAMYRIVLYRIALHCFVLCCLRYIALYCAMLYCQFSDTARLSLRSVCTVLAIDASAGQLAQTMHAQTEWEGRSLHLVASCIFWMPPHLAPPCNSWMDVIPNGV